LNSDIKDGIEDARTPILFPLAEASRLTNRTASGRQLRRHRPVAFNESAPAKANERLGLADFDPRVSFVSTDSRDSSRSDS